MGTRIVHAYTRSATNVRMPTYAVFTSCTTLTTAYTVVHCHPMYMATLACASVNTHVGCQARMSPVGKEVPPFEAKDPRGAQLARDQSRKQLHMVCVDTLCMVYVVCVCVCV